MPLSAPIERKPLHTRKVSCLGYIREDDLIDIECHLFDTRPIDFPSRDRGGVIKAGEALHGMSIRITIDQEMVIKKAEAVMDFTPYDYCKPVSEVFKKLIGIRIGLGWRGKIREIMGGIKGCTHLTELLESMASTAFQSMVSVTGPAHAGKTSSQAKEFKEPLFINTCHTHAVDSPVVREYWPDSYKPKNSI